MLSLTVAAAAFVTSLILTPIARALAVRHGLLDLPNERSSHERPTPRSGGYAIVVAMVLGVAVSGSLRAGWMMLVGAAVGVALTIAAVDERRPLPRWSRLVVQIGIAIALVASAPLVLPGIPSALGWGIGTVWIVYSINAYNFMDGLNGIASVTAVVCGTTFGLMALAKGDAPAAALAFASAGACAGFLPFNLPSGSIFMGDTGSATLGLIFGALVLRLISDGVSPVASVLPLAPFFLDAGLTILRRMLRGERFFSTPHRAHFYQRMQQQGFTHAAVAGVYGLLALGGAVLALFFDSLSAGAAAATTVAFGALHIVIFFCIETGWRRSQPAANP